MLTIGDLLFDPASRRLMRDQGEVRLSPKAACVLLALAETPGQVWSRDALLERVWPTLHVGEEVLTHAIAELRRAFGDDFREPRYLATIHKYGYRLVASARTAEADVALSDMESASSDEPVTLDAYAAYPGAVELYERGGRENTEAASATFSELTRVHPHFALAHSSLAKSQTFLSAYYRHGQNAPAALLAHCITARRINPNSADALAAEGFIHSMLGAHRRSHLCFQAALAVRRRNTLSARARESRSTRPRGSGAHIRTYGQPAPG